DDPDAFAGTEDVRAEEPRSGLQRPIVSGTVLLVYFAPLSPEMAGEVGERPFTGFLECGQGTGGGEDPPEGEGHHRSLPRASIASRFSRSAASSSESARTISISSRSPKPWS